MYPSLRRVEAVLAPGQLLGPFVEGDSRTRGHLGFPRGCYGGQQVLRFLGLLLMLSNYRGSQVLGGCWIWLLKAKRLEGILQPTSKGGRELHR